MLIRWSIDKSDVAAIVRDNAANIKSATTLLNVEAFGCCCHSLSLCVKAAILDQPSLVTICEIGRKIVAHFNYSTKSFKLFNSIQKSHHLAENVLFQDNNTRWNSSYLMLQRLLDNEAALIEYASTTAPDSYVTFSHAQWKIIAKVCVVLKKFHELTQEFSKASSSIGMVIPAVHEIKVILI